MNFVCSMSISKLIRIEQDIEENPNWIIDPSRFNAVYKDR